jgi:Domain of unknown function (DUF4430)
MKRRYLLALAGATTALAVAPTTAALAAKVTVRVEGKRKTLLNPSVVKTGSGSISKFGAPAGACSAASAQGALDVATHHNWIGTWSTTYGPEYFVTSILGESYATSKTYFWEIFVNNVSATMGGCEIKLHSGDQLLFAADTGTQYPIVLTAPAHVTTGHKFTVRVVAYTAKGKTKPLAGATVSVGGLSGKTGNHGTVLLTSSHAGTFTLKAAHAGYIRAAPVTLRVS